MDKKIEKIANEIKELKIQGARRIAKAALDCLELQVRTSKAENGQGLYSEMAEVADLLASQRPTEPMLRNTLRHVLSWVDESMEIENMKRLLLEGMKQYFRKVDDNLAKLGHFGAQELQDNCTVLTHCHSNTVMAVLKNAYDMGKKFRVICKETRPRMQGLLTAEELSDYGIDVTLIVDSAVGAYIKQVDIALVGADAVTTTGDLINKIGTRVVAELCEAYKVQFYCATELYKYDPMTQWGVVESIEQRDRKEIVGNRKTRFKVENPAFDLTPARLIGGYITEKGILPPGMLMLAAKSSLIEEAF